MSKHLVWVTNIINHKNSSTVDLLFGQSPHNGYIQHSRIRNQFIEGDPKATKTHTANELKEMGYIGLYKFAD